MKRLLVVLLILLVPLAAAYAAVTATSLNPTTKGWTVNATSADASSCEQVKAAPGAGKYLVLRRVSIATDANITVTIGSGESGNGVEAVLIGPVPYAAGTGNWTDVVLHPAIKLPANKSLTVDASGAGNVWVLAQGETK